MATIPPLPVVNNDRDHYSNKPRAFMEKDLITGKIDYKDFF